MNDSSSTSPLALVKQSLTDSDGDQKPPSLEAVNLLENFKDFFTATAAETMVPRTEMASVEGSTTVREALEHHHQSGHSRLPVHESRRDNIIGILHAIDLMAFVSRGEFETPVSEIMRKPFFISYSQPIHQVLSLFRAKRTHMALVIDEYGGVDGVLTLSDIVEELVGDMPDEFDKDPEPSFEEVEDGLIVMDANFALEDFNDHFQTEFIKDGIETIGGYACHVLGKIPGNAEKFTIDHIPFSVVESNERRLFKLKLPAPPSK
ncbi:MAG: CBS domain-containing protein [SAR324 cluster bacterium]|nr:CBS domain-containing protein [SAR324 cluster bacterium]